MAQLLTAATILAENPCLVVSTWAPHPHQGAHNQSPVSPVPKDPTSLVSVALMCIYSHTDT